MPVHQDAGNLLPHQPSPFGENGGIRQPGGMRREEMMDKNPIQKVRRALYERLPISISPRMR
jgi:hypothetical protein